MQDSASERKSIRAAEKRAAQVDRARGDFVRVMMSSIEGRLYQYEFLASCNVFHSTFNLNSMQMAFAEGQRNVGLQLLNDIMRFCPEQYLPMIREANVRHDSNNRTARPRPSSDDAAPAEYSGSEDFGRDDQGPIDTTGDYNPYRNEDA